MEYLTTYYRLFLEMFIVIIVYQYALSKGKSEAIMSITKQNMRAETERSQQQMIMDMMNSMKRGTDHES